MVEWLFTETPFHRSGFSPNVLFTERAAIHLWDCSPNVLQYNRAHTAALVKRCFGENPPHLLNKHITIVITIVKVTPQFVASLESSIMLPEASFTLLEPHLWCLQYRHYSQLSLMILFYDRNMFIVVACHWGNKIPSAWTLCF